MKTLLKILVVLILLIVLLVGLLIFIGFRSIDSVAKQLIERGGTYATGVETTVDSADVDIFGGAFAMSGLNIANPEGYPSPHFLALDDGAVSVSYETMQQDTVTLPELTLTGVDVYLDRTGGTANYNVILDNLKKLESGDKPPATDEQGGGQTFVIDTLTIDGVTARVTGIAGVSQALGDLEVTVPKIVLNNVGAQDGGMTMPELVNLIIKTVLTTTIEAGGGVIPADMLGDLQGQLSQLASLDSLGIDLTADLGEIGQQIQEQIGEQAQEQIESAVEDATKQLEESAGDAIRGLLGGSDDDP